MGIFGMVLSVSSLLLGRIQARDGIGDRELFGLGWAFGFREEWDMMIMQF